MTWARSRKNIDTKFKRSSLLKNLLPVAPPLLAPSKHLKRRRLRRRLCRKIV
jgi:hypothetical protein